MQLVLASGNAGKLAELRELLDGTGLALRAQAGFGVADAEETGVTSVELLAKTEEWIAYAFPADYGGTKQARGFAGQKQKWFAFRFTGDESEIDLEQHAEIEFDAWRWGRLDEAPALIVPFKRAAYEQVVAAFAPLVV